MKKKVKILIVDDQPSKLFGYEVILAELGENLIQATSGSDALHQLLKNDIAVVLMDVSMPELDTDGLPASALRARCDHLCLCRPPGRSRS